MARFRDADSDDDGKLSRSESPERMKQNFDRIDTNGDGFVDKEEFEAVIRRMREGGGNRPPRDDENRGRREGGDQDTERRRPELE